MPRSAASLAARERAAAARPRGKVAFKQTDVTRAIKAARAAGVEISRIEIDTGGPQSKITIIAGKPESQTAKNDLDAELAEFEARRGQG
jgi:hypothetical protein